MGVPVLIIGKSGSGKSASMRNLNPADVALINVLGKPLPFKGKFEQVTTDDYGKVHGAIEKCPRDIIVIDDAGYLMTNQFMRGHSSAGKGNDIFLFYNYLADNFWRLIEAIGKLPAHKRVYVMMHEDTNDAGDTKPKTIGKLLDEKVNIPGMFTICLRCVLSDGKRVFRTQTDGSDVAKSPISLFSDLEIDNDLLQVDNAIKAYYEINDTKEEQPK